MRSLRITRALVAASAGALVIASGPALAAQASRPADAAGHAVLLVCNGSTKPCPSTTATIYTTVQAAVDAAHANDTILIWPGVYHENNVAKNAGVYVSTPGLHIIGMNRNTVIIDGSEGAHPCASDPAKQGTFGRNGIEVVASGVWVENLTVCDYLGNNGAGGNEIWWNGGDGSGKIGMGKFYGAYLTATAQYHPTFVKGTPDPYFAQYGIFVSNASGYGMIRNSYASNMADAAYYVGACQQLCHTWLLHDTGINSSLGYSGTNAGGTLIILRSTFIDNRAGIVPNSLNNDDAPPPQDGQCPHNSGSCTKIEHNMIIANNNPNVPLFGYSAAIGTGVELSGGMYDTVRYNVIKDNGAWGVITHDYPDTEKPPPASHCQGGYHTTFLGSKACDFPARGNQVYGNKVVNDGFFGNPANSDLATLGLSARSPKPRNCFYGNRAWAHGKRVPVTSSPANIEQPSVDGPACGLPGTWNDPALLAQLACASLGILCSSHAKYPQQTEWRVLPLPRRPSMPDVCARVPANDFCKTKN